ncbi:MAG: IPT/TIG domain-containing protein [Opitutaceae bacterium]|nr:IPT/TIG domain-containing protein [Opitutaceae bacterium]
MQNSRILPTRKIFSWMIALCALALLAGCNDVTITNLTPPSLTDNPSRIHTITLRVDQNRSSVVPGSIVPHIVIDGENHEMRKSRIGAGFYEYDYHLPPGRSELAYYFLVNYAVEFNDRNEPREAYTELNRVSVVNRYVLTLEANRGPVGARISVLGRGFTPQDALYFDGNPVRTIYESTSSLSFFVPALAPGHTYNVVLSGANGSSPIGAFLIDSSALTVTPSALTMRTGSVQPLTFSVPNPAPAGGLLLDVTTDVPESVIMPEVIVPAGETSVTINVQGGRPGSGSLFLKGYASGEVTVPVTVAK